MPQDNNKKVLNCPPLRFPEFKDEWEKVTLGEIGETIIGLTYSPSDVVSDSGTIVLRSSNIKNGMIDYSDLVRVNKNIKERLVTRQQDILVCSRNGSARLIGKNALLSDNDANNTFGAFMMVFRSSDNLFIHPLLSTNSYLSQVGENLGARINQITSSDFNSFKFYIPTNTKERTKIGELFHKLNERIATQNKIIEKLQSLIRGIREKLICQESPNSKWIKLGDICKITTGKLDANAMVDGGKYPFFTCAESPFSIDKYAFDTEAILVSGNGANLGYINYYAGKFNAYQRTYVLSHFTENIHFVKNALKIYLPKRIAIEKSTSNTPYIVLSTLSELKILTPERKRQSHIDKVLSVFENKLVVEEKILTIFTMQRNHLLSQMFI